MAYNKSFDTNKQEYSIRTKNYADDFIPESVLDENDPIYKLTHPNNVLISYTQNVDINPIISDSMGPLSGSNFGLPNQQ